ncbi:Glutathione S-transferase [Trichoplax sp. H2]|uniref:Glutathione S-transferase n=1 Tax=Trichoplax adhaerens TaxID=10228 RepID=B3S2F4_TRIAD|nr:hypothetical protein TRIADDRAFT_58006 [Trichoplax adhaerens]EDV23407.1 hypothetical protein TRIADDRAFT_58006 [Trichoplax adhaerens]RDD47886.1 Glutathione S-transferase [Trichoplax sp. H2]|eukprot:XP_002114317.1 hypothetical protein TRIADDRAFT_58006 [Trichoplax adhaerens]
MPTYKLTYFNIRARAEVARYLFVLADVPFIDERISEEDWPTYKQTVKNPFRRLPVLEVDGKVFIESIAIESYLALTFGFHGKNNWEKYKIDMITYSVDEMFTKMFTSQFEPDEEKKRNLQEDYCKYKSTWLKALEAGLESDYLVGNTITLADLEFFCISEYLLEQNQSLFENCPRLKSLFDRIANNKKIADWLSKRSKSVC